MSLGQRGVGVIVLVASLLALALSAYSGWRSYAYTQCQAGYNEVNNERTRALSEAADQERAAQRRTDDAERALFTDPALSKAAAERTPAEQARIQGLFREYQNALTALEQERAEADKARKDHPVPAPPSKTCG